MSSFSPYQKYLAEGGVGHCLYTSLPLPLPWLAVLIRLKKADIIATIRSPGVGGGGCKRIFA